MIKIAHVVEDIIMQSDDALAALQQGYLNLSAYSKAIHKQVECQSKKPVQLGSIIITLSRLKQDMKKVAPLFPKIKLDGIAVKSGLIEIAFERTEKNLDRLRDLYKNKRLTSSEFFATTQGASEITIICTEQDQATVQQIFRPVKPKAVVEQLVALTAKLHESYIHTPNTFYAFMRKFSVKRINIVEMISTFSEITFLVEQKNLQDAFAVLNESFKL